MNTTYQSPTHGSVRLGELRRQILKFIAKNPIDKYRLVIGTDSQSKNDLGVDFITAIVVHHIGVGGIYFWKRHQEKRKMVLRERIYHEATLSLIAADEFLHAFKNDGISKYDVEIHVDIGTVGKTREMLSEVVGMVRGLGFTVKTKPDSYGASKVADRYT